LAEPRSAGFAKKRLSVLNLNLFKFQLNFNSEGGCIMARETSRTVIKVAIVALSMQETGSSAANAALGPIAESMPDVPVQLIQMITTLSAVTMAVAPPIYAKLVELMRKKSLMTIAALLFVIGGTSPAFFHSNIWIILLCRFAQGIGNGIILPMCTDYVFDFFSGSERHTVLGWVSAMTGLSGTIFTTVGGWLSGIEWYYCFYTYLISVVFLTIPIVLMPEPDRKGRIEREKADLAARGLDTKARIPGIVYLHALFVLIFMVFTWVVMTDTSIVLLQEGLASPAQIGMMISCHALGALAAGFFFGPIFKRAGYAYQVFAYVIGAVGFALIYFAPNAAVFLIGLALDGVAMGACIPSTMTKCNSFVPYSKNTMVIAIVNIFIGVGGFLNPFVFGLFGAPGRWAFGLAGIGYLIFAVIVFAVNKAYPSPLAAEDEKAAAAL
jgi:MFS family permease